MSYLAIFLGTVRVLEDSFVLRPFAFVRGSDRFFQGTCCNYKLILFLAKSGMIGSAYEPIPIIPPLCYPIQIYAKAP